ncbi:MopE-related protein [Desulfosediminicola sp.]|uniref:MopE-related protein n=1 Tax=Desulfosediminicola sp. TaxID=2886825 RepID=UPI003AF2261C
MRKFILCSALVLVITALSGAAVMAAKPVDNDGDGVTERSDCNDNNALIYPGAAEICTDGLDNNCDGLIDSADPTCTAGVCSDADGDGYGFPADPSCSYTQEDCNDTLASINPGASEVCDNGVDDNCDGLTDTADPACGTNPHASNTWQNYPLDCLSCHDQQFNEMADSTHYWWVGDTTEMANQNGTLQGKLTNSVNSYCINILGDWPVCGKCHVGRGKRPDDPQADKTNIDCLACHNEDYAMARTRLADGSMAPSLAGVENPTAEELQVLDGYTQNINAPTRKNCLKCHAFAGGGNAVKRGDLSMSGTDLHGATLLEGTDNNSDPNFDVHMNVMASDLKCQSCHVFQNHKTIGRGSDLRPTDDLARGSEVKCVTCHAGFDVDGGHAAAGANRTDADRHVSKVACQSCHIDHYAKVATELNRDWRYSHDGTPADGTNGPGHPELTIGEDLSPVYKFWNRLSDNYLLGDVAVIDPETGAYPTSRPIGDINDGKLYPFKYKTGVQPMVSSDSKLVALDTYEYLAGSGDVDQAVQSGLVNMGYPSTEPVEWVTTDTYQLLNHGIAPAANVDCAKCHGDLDLATFSELDNLGYALKGPKAQICSQCHREKNLKSDHPGMHNHVDKGVGMDCLFCHSFSRQEERGGISPCDSNATDFVDTNPFAHPECSQ